MATQSASLTITSGPVVTLHLPSEIPSSEATTAAVSGAFTNRAQCGVTTSTTTSGTPESKLSSDRVSTMAERCPFAEVTREQCEELLAPIGQKIRELMANFNMFLSPVLDSLIRCPIAGHPLWKLQMDQVMDLLGRDVVVQFLSENIRDIPHRDFVTFVAYLASRKDFSTISPLDGCKRFELLIDLESLAANNPGHDRCILPMAQEYVAKEAERLVQSTTETMFLDFPRLYQQITIDPHSWAENKPSIELGDLLWEALWARIESLKTQHPDQPLQIFMLNNSYYVIHEPHLFAKYKTEAVSRKIFFRMLFKDPRGQYEEARLDPSTANRFELGLPWRNHELAAPERNLELAASLLAYLKEQKLLAFPANV